MEDSIIIHRFLDYLKFERRFSEHTAKCYGADLTQFCEFLRNRSDGSGIDEDSLSSVHGETHDTGTATAVATQVEVKIDQLLLAATTEAVRAYLAFLNEKDYSKATVARKLATLRSFYKFLVKRNHVTSNPDAQAGKEAASLSRVR